MNPSTSGTIGRTIKTYVGARGNALRKLEPEHTAGGESNKKKNIVKWILAIRRPTKSGRCRCFDIPGILNDSLFRTSNNKIPSKDMDRHQKGAT